MLVYSNPHKNAMQIYAYDAQGTLTGTMEADRRALYSCPECAAPLRLRRGPLRKSHFYHVKQTPCRQSGKSLTHLNIQYALQKQLLPETIYLEHRFPEIGRIADLFWPAQKLIFEVQVSPISAAEVKARNRDYHQIGFQVVWILHDRQFNRTQLTAAEAHLRFSPHYFTDMNGFGKGIFYDQYAKIHLRRRVVRGFHHPVSFLQPTPVDLKQLPRHFPEERRRWKISFKGDLFHQEHNWDSALQTKTFRLSLFSIYRFLINILLERTTL